MSDVMDILVRRERADQPDIVPLIEASDAFANALYPPESNHFVDIATLCDPAVVFLVARRAGCAIGCGALLRDPRGWGEIKRMFVTDEARGQKLGARILGELERIADAGACISSGSRPASTARPRLRPTDGRATESARRSGTIVRIR